MAGEDVGERRCAAAIGDHVDGHADGLRKQRRAEMREAAGAGMRELDAGAGALHPRRHLGHAVGGQRLAADQHHRAVIDEADPGQLFLRVIRQLEQGHIGGDRELMDQDGVPVGGGARHAPGGDGTAAAGDVLDHHALAEHGRHALADHARGGIGRAARRIGHHDGDSAGRERIGRGGHSGERAHGDQERRNGVAYGQQDAPPRADACCSVAISRHAPGLSLIHI